MATLVLVGSVGVAVCVDGVACTSAGIVTIDPVAVCMGEPGTNVPRNGLPMSVNVTAHSSAATARA
jgi:hypothetical protein